MLYDTYCFFVNVGLRSHLTRVGGSKTTKPSNDERLAQIFLQSDPVVLMAQRRHQINFRLHLQHLNDVILLVDINCDRQFVQIFYINSMLMIISF